MDSLPNKDDILVWILVPVLETDDPTLQYYYDYTQSLEEYTRVFEELGYEWKWVNVRFDSIVEVIEGIRDHPTSKVKTVINLCDGDEANRIAGISVIDELERCNLIYTGSNRAFYDLTTSKIPMKEAFDLHGVPTPRWKVIDDGRVSFKELQSVIGETMIVKPAISAGSLGLSIRNVVTHEAEFHSILNEMKQGFHGWKLDTGGTLIEEFIKGREFTTLIVGSSSIPESLEVYMPVERVFHSSLPDNEQFLSYDRLWETYDKETPLPENGSLYSYYQPDDQIVKRLKELTIKAYQSVGGTGYGRLDIRLDKTTDKLYVLEVNAQCGLSEDENYTSIGAILRFTKKTFTYLILEIMEDAMKRYGAKHKARL
jgi:D-alanine-D-alanine ligase